METKNKRRSGIRGSFNQKRSYGFGSGNKRRGGFSKNKRGGGSSFSKRIDISRFVNKSSNNQKIEPYVSLKKFSDFNFNSKLDRNIKQKGYLLPTEIQEKTISIAMNNSDVIGVANTGTGKTAAFLLPLINKVIEGKNERVLIVAPTRELAFQIQEELFSLTKFTGINSVVCTGGSNIGMQISKIRRNPSFVIGTPGRLKDLVQRKIISFENFRTVVLDEADRMLDMGFIDDIKFLMNEIKVDHQTLLFSATISPSIESLIKTFLKNPVKISVKRRETAENVDQDIVRFINEKDKMDKLCEMLENGKDFHKVLVFGKTKIGVEKIFKEIKNRGFKVASIHGDKPQSKRRQALELFKLNKVQILIATDVAARGLDISDVSHVINFDIPATYDDYVHRIGRTGRANQRGVALTFVN